MIGLTVVAIGMSLPELVASTAAGVLLALYAGYLAVVIAGR